MTTTPPVAARGPRAPQPAGNDAEPASDEEQTQQRALATQRAAFNYEVAEQAELEREREVLEEMLQAQLKFEDEIVKKWIAMI